MCTAATYRTKDFYFGRTLDYEYSYEEEVVITPRKFPFSFSEQETVAKHYAMIGTASVMEDYPLYYDAVNEKGLCMAGLNFVENAYYRKAGQGKDNVAQYELIPWILSRCASVKEARERLGNLNITDVPFRSGIPAARLHWLIADRTEAIVLESVKEGILVYDNPTGVLTNDPPFPIQMSGLRQYLHLSAKTPENTFAPGLSLKPDSRGLGAVGLPGDLSSRSRFVRAVFTKMNSVSNDGENESVSQFFHILHSVEQQRGCCDLGGGKYATTIYTACCNADRGIYYYTAYDNHQITAVDLHQEALDAAETIRCPLIKEERIFFQNRKNRPAS